VGALTIMALGLLTAGAPIKLAAVGFTQIGLSSEQAAFYSEHFAVKLAEDPTFSVATSKDLAALLGLERQKALLGCSDGASSCMAELAGALGVAGVVTGQVARVGQSFQLSVKVLAADGSKLLFVYASELVSSEEKLLGEVTRIARLAGVRLKEELGAAEATAGLRLTTESSGSPPLLRLSPAVAGLVALAVGVGLAADAGGRWRGHLQDAS
jgi:hypothetical protein